MTRSCLLLVAVICLGLGSPVQAQTAKIQREVEDKLRQRRFHEDVEIMRRLLNRSLWSVAAFGFGSGWTSDAGWLDYSHSMGMSTSGGTPLFAPTYRDLTTHFPGMPGAGKGSASVPHHAMEGEGTYLKGQGVLFTLTLPRTAQDPRPESARPAGKPLSDWEILRRELRGEKVEGTGGRREQREPRVADVVLRLLAENGKHLTQLAPDEQVTVAITFRGHQCATCHGAGMNLYRPGGSTGAGEGGIMMRGEDPGTTEMRGPGGGTPGGEAGGPAPSGALGREEAPDKGGTSPGKGRKETGNPYIQRVLEQVNDQVLLGDLKYKQGLFRDAVKAYQEAARSHKDALESLALFPNVTKQQSWQTHLAGAELHGKLAQAQLVLGEKEDALRSLAQVSEHAKAVEGLARPAKAASGQATAKPSGEAPIQLAPKLVISAPKKLLDQVGQGKMTFEEFKKTVTVEYLAFEADAKP